MVRISDLGDEGFGFAGFGGVAEWKGKVPDFGGIGAGEMLVAGVIVGPPYCSTPFLQFRVYTIRVWEF